jgi:D-3-phosphoglycerate dehydrogenase
LGQEGLKYEVMKILIADKFEESGIRALQEAGFDLIVNPDLKEESLKQALEDLKPEGLIVRSTRVDESHMVDSLRLIVRAGAGYNTIDVESARRKGIQVSNCPGKNARAVAELTFGLILALDRRIPDNVEQLRQGKWNKKEFSQARGIFGRTLGVVGFGNIGKLVAEMAKCFGLNVLVFSRHAREEEVAQVGARKVDLLELARGSDIVSVHCALTKETERMLGKEFFDALKPGTYFINTSRSEVIDQEALLEVVRTKDIRAGLDVFEGEPSSTVGEYQGVLRDLPNVYCTHHIGASTLQAQEAVAEETVRIFLEFAKTGKAPNCVNC